jgi:hypothetical protein
MCYLPFLKLKKQITCYLSYNIYKNRDGLRAKKTKKKRKKKGMVCESGLYINQTISKPTLFFFLNLFDIKKFPCPWLIF